MDTSTHDASSLAAILAEAKRERHQRRKKTWADYERLKQQVIALNLPANEYEYYIMRLCEALGIRANNRTKRKETR